MSTSVLETEKLISSLSQAEKVQILYWIVRDLGDSFPGIEHLPGVAGGAACIVRTRIPVWLLEQSRRLGASETAILHAYPSLRASDLMNAWAYVITHKVEIDEAINQNDAD